MNSRARDSEKLTSITDFRFKAELLFLDEYYNIRPVHGICPSSSEFEANGKEQDSGYFIEFLFPTPDSSYVHMFEVTGEHHIAANICTNVAISDGIISKCWFTMHTLNKGEIAAAIHSDHEKKTIDWIGEIVIGKSNIKYQIRFAIELFKYSSGRTVVGKLIIFLNKDIAESATKSFIKNIRQLDLRNYV